MLRKIRIILAAVCFTLITLLLLDFSGTLHHWLGWLAKVQLLPAVLALNAVVIVVLALLTLVFGRIYCSVICPLGVFQDIVSWIHGRKKKNRFSYSPAKNWLRYAMLVLLIVAVVLGLGIVIALLAPYGTYGRFVNTFLQPLYVWGNNVLASISEHFDAFSASSDRVRLVKMGSVPLDDLMMHCKLLVTDYSSVCWDLYYMGKPTIFYQYDTDKYMDTWGSYIDLEKDTPGYREDTLEGLVSRIRDSIEGGFALDDYWKSRREEHFKYIDRDNCKRIVEELKERNYL